MSVRLCKLNEPYSGTGGLNAPIARQSLNYGSTGSYLSNNLLYHNVEWSFVHEENFKMAKIFGPSQPV